MIGRLRVLGPGAYERRAAGHFLPGATALLPGVVAAALDPARQAAWHPVLPPASRPARVAARLPEDRASRKQAFAEPGSPSSGGVELKECPCGSQQEVASPWLEPEPPSSDEPGLALTALREPWISGQKTYPHLLSAWQTAQEIAPERALAPQPGPGNPYLW